ncbi:type II toxin-antitoxin system Phd/YefM family antitoxin [Nitrospirillum sp. BR 11163]|uniref:type II toxin-antitoxin system Phd/YefM family antitoxin n=1 Tax=Nitrospirillum sp. BR 11163 TaxID=3104323 RepID=UPI002AFF4699|nr:type II toxin-antitoxin system Phd/YefM family antitoxin [Nitrospirillum sp. BR 11163]MEA1674943.1 type II toxin-antitoxin system Phd/YefM family antitoxin [Nitrospirillum sp. BR 11163]
MVARRSSIEALPRRNATQVRSRWAEVAREVQVSGSVAITNHDRVEMVLVSAEEYERLATKAAGGLAQQQATLDRLVAQFDAELATLREPGARDRLEDMLASKGQGGPRPKAGYSY